MPGDRTKAALSNILAETLAKHQEATAGATAAMRGKAVTGFLEQMEVELAPVMEAAFGWLADAEDLPDVLKPIVAGAVRPTHQVDAIFQFAMTIVAAVTSAGAVAAPSAQKLINDQWTKHPFVPLSPDAAAVAVLKGVDTYEVMADEAAKSGLGRLAFDVMVNIAGEPPGPEQLLAAYRRDIINRDRLEHGIKQSRVRNEWTDVVEALRFAPMSPADAIEALVQSHLDEPTARAIAAQGGLLPEHFGPLVETRGNPPGPETMLELLNRGIVDQPTVVQALRESRLKNKYIDAMIRSRVRLPPERTVVAMVERGVITQDRGVAKLVELGFSHDDAAALVQEGLNRKHAATKDLALGEIKELYKDGLIDHGQAAGFVTQLGYDDTEAGFILAVVDTQVKRQETAAAMTRVRSLYVSYHIDRSRASALLDQLGVKTATRDDLLHLWDLERDANAKQLTLAELRQLYRAQIIDKPKFLAKVKQIGFGDEDAGLLEQLTAPV